MNSALYFEAIREGQLDSLKQMLAGQPELLEAQTDEQNALEIPIRCTGLHAAVHAGHIDVVRLLLDAGIDIDAKRDESRSALHDAIEFGEFEIVELLIERGADVDICSAAILGHMERLKQLLDADPALANDRSTQLSPLGWASFGNRVDSAAELIRHGARMDDGELLCAASVDGVEVGQLLIENGADPDEVIDDAGGNALHAAASMRYTHDSTRFVRMLMDAGADPTRKSAKGKTALEIAEEYGRRQERELADKPDEARKQYDQVAELLRNG